jgi:Tfp pilus assembly protein PilP
MTIKLAKTTLLVTTNTVLTALLATALFVAAGVAAQSASSPKKITAKPRAKAGGSATPTRPAGSTATVLPAAPGKRDPFEPLINEHKENATGIHLPPGKAGLVVATVRVDGTVNSQGGMIAIVSNPEQHVYFIREGDRLYDGDVEKIGLDGVTFRENSKDAFGKPIERVVTKRIYASAGEQQ